MHKNQREVFTGHEFRAINFSSCNFKKTCTRISAKYSPGHEFRAINSRREGRTYELNSRNKWFCYFSVVIEQNTDLCEKFSSYLFSVHFDWITLFIHHNAHLIYTNTVIWLLHVSASLTPSSRSLHQDLLLKYNRMKKVIDFILHQSVG